MRLSFQAAHELGVLSFFTLLALYVWTHHSSLPDFNIFAVRGSRTRIWHETTPPVPSSVRQLEQRLNTDLDAFEKSIKAADGVRPSQPMSWNKIIWQSWRNKELRDWRDTWTRDNPDWDYKLVLDEQADTLIRTTYAQVPDVLDIWGSLHRPVIKADLFRYLVVYAYGGALLCRILSQRGHNKLTKTGVNVHNNRPLHRCGHDLKQTSGRMAHTETMDGP